MTWSTDPQTHAEMVCNIQDVYNEPDDMARMRRALAHVKAAVAYYSEPNERVGSYCSVLAQAALYPEVMKAASQ
jgi:hypothetical protein